MRDIVDEFDFFLCAPAGEQAPATTPVQGTCRTHADDTVSLTLGQPGADTPELFSIPPDTPLVEVVRLLSRRMA